MNEMRKPALIGVVVCAAALLCSGALFALDDGDGPGTHDHPYSLPTGNSAIAGRLQVNVNDLSIPGAEYFFELHYVTHDEAPGNRYNNASWIQVNMPPYPPIPVELGATTHARRADVTAASIALPPSDRICAPTAADDRFWAATIPAGPSTGCCNSS